MKQTLIPQTLTLYPWFTDDNKGTRTNVFYNSSIDPKKGIYPYLVTNIIAADNFSITKKYWDLIQSRSFVYVNDDKQMIGRISLTKSEDGHFAAWMIVEKYNRDYMYAYDVKPFKSSKAITLYRSVPVDVSDYALTSDPELLCPLTVAEKLVKETFEKAGASKIPNIPRPYTDAPTAKESKKNEPDWKGMYKDLVGTNGWLTDECKRLIDENKKLQTKVDKLEDEVEKSHKGISTGHIGHLVDTETEGFIIKATILEAGIPQQKSKVKMTVQTRINKRNGNLSFFVNGYQISFHTMLDVLEILDSRAHVAQKINDIWDIVTTYYKERVPEDRMGYRDTMLSGLGRLLYI